MDNFSLITSVALINLLAAMSPGPDFVMCVRNSVIYSRKTGIYTGIGISLGLIVHIAYCAAGIAIIISKSAIIFSIIKYAGAIYLAYMGISSIFSKSSGLGLDDAIQQTDISALKAIRIGFLTNILNPKATMFFLGLFTLVIGSKTPIYILLIITFIVIMTAVLWFSLVAVLFSHKQVKNIFQKIEKPINLVLGGLLVFLAIKIALI